MKKYHQKKRFAPEALRRLRDYSWPGNIQELRNTVERVMVLCPGDLVTEQVSRNIAQAAWAGRYSG
mgnify:CR=1 FL=1